MDVRLNDVRKTVPVVCLSLSYACLMPLALPLDHINPIIDCRCKNVNNL